MTCCDAIVQLTKSVVSLGKQNAWQQALGAFAEAEDAGLDVFFCSALVTCCARAAAWPGSLQLLADTRHHRVEPNAATFSSAVNACGGRWEQGLGALRHASLLQLQLNTICLGAACALDLGWPKAATLLAELCEGALEVSATACNSAVSSCTRGTSWRQGLQVAFGMLERHLRPSRVTFNAGISACDAGHDGLMGLKLLRAMDGSHLQPDIVSYNAAVSACGKSSLWGSALELLQEAPRGALRLDLVSMGAAVDAAAERWAMAEVLLGQLRRDLQPNEVLQTSLLKGHARGGEWARALGALSMPNEKSFGAAADACASCGQWADAEELMRAMALQHVRLGTAAFNAATEALQGAELWRRALTSLELLRSTGLQLQA
ncbi:unnamed protein product, partial [Effrenium voratum]